VQVHKGTIKCESSEGRGAKFIITLPLIGASKHVRLQNERRTSGEVSIAGPGMGDNYSAEEYGRGSDEAWIMRDQGSDTPDDLVASDLEDE
jgi:hypothetical protein